MVRLMPLPPHHLLLQHNSERFILLVPAYPGCPGKRPLNVCQVSCVTVYTISQMKLHAKISSIRHALSIEPGTAGDSATLRASNVTRVKTVT